jgi:hypothetical protein
LSANVRPRPPLNPQRLAIVFAAQFQHDPARVYAFADGFKRFLQSTLRVRCIGDKTLPVRVRHIGFGDAERF